MDKEKTPIYETCGEPLIVNIYYIFVKKNSSKLNNLDKTLGLDKVDNIIIFYLKKYKSI